MSSVVARIAATIGLTENELISASLNKYLNDELLQLEAELSRLTLEYDVKSAREMEERYRTGQLEEDGSWEDFFRLDYLESKRVEFLHALKELK